MDRQHTWIVSARYGLSGGVERRAVYGYCFVELLVESESRAGEEGLWQLADAGFFIILCQFLNL